MENKRFLDMERPKWIEIWTRQLLQQITPALAEPEQASAVIEALLMATTRGESCIDFESQTQHSLAQLALHQRQLQLDPTSTAQQAVIAPLIYDDQRLYLYRYWHLEQRLATHIHRIQQSPVSMVDLTAFKDLLSDEYQAQALAMVANQGLSVITGGPGTGKTYTLARIIAVLNHANADLRIAMAAPTGKAAQRMQEALQYSFSDQDLQKRGLVNDQLKQQDTLTLHRLLGLGHHAQPRYHSQNPLPYDVIVVDEASMLDLQIACYLFEAVSAGCRLILLGDAQQLASVDVGAVLADLQQSSALSQNRVHLHNSRRFKSDALIGKMAKFIQSQHNQQQYSSESQSKAQPVAANNTQDVLAKFEAAVVVASELRAIELSDDMKDVVLLQYLSDVMSDTQLQHYYQQLSQGFESYFNVLGEYAKAAEPLEMLSQVIRSFDQYRILTPIHFGHLGLAALNQAVQQALFKHQHHIVQHAQWYLGRPVMMTYNDDQLGLSNGDIGICLYHRSQVGQFEVYFPSLDYWVAATRLPKSIQTAFAMTIHKSQGSEFRHVAVVLDVAAQRLLSQELIYTAITRAKSAVSLLVHPDSFSQSLRIKTSRKSGLVEKISALF